MPRNEKYNVNKPNINYLNKDFTNLKDDLINYAKTYFPTTYKDFNETSPGMMLMEMNAYVGDVLSFYIDQQFKEMFVPTVEERTNIINLAKTFGYNIKPIIPAVAQLEFSQTVGATGEGPVKTPHMVSASVLHKGAVCTSDVSGIDFQVLDIVDFNLTGSYTPEISEVDSNTGIPTKFILKTTVPAVSAATKIQNFTIDQPVEFLRLTIPDENVVSIVSVVDSNNNPWYQVDYLAQDKVYDEVHWTDGTQSNRNGAYDDDSDGSTLVVSTPIPYRLNDMKVVNKRFIIETNPDNTTSLVFGNGLIRSKGNLDTSALEDVVADSTEINALIQGTLPSNLNPTVDYRSLGESPSNTTLTVTYRVGGGINTNVPSNSITSISSKRSLLDTYNATSFQSITVTNPKEAAGGADEESIDQIRENIKGHFAAQNRCVTKEDYEARALALPSRFGSIAKVYVRRRGYEEVSSALSPFNFDQTDANQANQIGGNEDRIEFENLLNDVMTNGTDWMNTPLNNVADWIDNLNANEGTIMSFKNLSMYILSYDENKNLIKTPTIIKQNLSRYLAQFKILSDDVLIEDGRIVNFGIKFRVIAREEINKSDLKLRCIEVIREYFNIDNMDFQQQFYIADIENLLYNVEGVKVVEEVKITQATNELEIDNPLYSNNENGSDDGVPPNNVGGNGPSNYGWAYNFGSITDGIILPPAEENPGVFELKNPLDNIKGEVL